MSTLNIRLKPLGLGLGWGGGGGGTSYPRDGQRILRNMVSIGGQPIWDKVSCYNGRLNF